MSIVNGPGVGAGVSNEGDGRSVGVGVGSGVGASVTSMVGVGVSTTAIVEGVAAEPCAAAGPTATQAADTSTAHTAT